MAEDRIETQEAQKATALSARTVRGKVEIEQHDAALDPSTRGLLPLRTAPVPDADKTVSAGTCIHQLGVKLLYA